jgi:hypothetical protein
VGRNGVTDVLAEFLNWGLQHGGALTLQSGDHPQRDRQTQQVEHQLLGRPLPEAIGPDQDAEDGPQPGAECSCGHTRRQGRTGAFAAPRAGKPVELVLVHLGEHRRQFGHLVPERFGVITVEVVATAPAMGRLVHDDLTQLFRRHQRADTSAMTRLPSPLLSRWGRRRAPLH